MTFTNSNWNTAQTVTATGVDDTDDDGNISYNINTGAASSSDSGYSGLNPDDNDIESDDEWGGFKQIGSTDKEDTGSKIVIDTEGNTYNW